MSWKRNFRNCDVVSVQNLSFYADWNNNLNDVNELSYKFVSDIISVMCPKVELNVPVQYIKNGCINTKSLNKDLKYKGATHTKNKGTWN